MKISNIFQTGNKNVNSKREIISHESYMTKILIRQTSFTNKKREHVSSILSEFMNHNIDYLNNSQKKTLQAISILASSIFIEYKM